MKICEIVASYGDGGLENHFVELCNGLAEKGHEVHVIIPLAFIDRFSDAIIVHRLPLHLSRRNIILLWQLFRTIKIIQPEIIHAHAGKGAELLSSFKRFIPYPCVATVHNNRKNLRCYFKMDAVIGVSNGVLDVLTHPQQKVVYNGVNLPNITMTKSDLIKKFNLSGKRPVIMAIGRFVDAKGFDILINAWQGIDADLLIIGDGPLKGECSAQIEELNLTKSVHLAGFIDNANSLITAADFIVISSRREGFNYVMAEALFQSIPVISTDVPAPNEILPKDYLVPVADSKALHTLLKHCLDNPDTLTSDYQAVFEWAQQTLSLDGMVSNTEKVFNDLIASSSTNKN